MAGLAVSTDDATHYAILNRVAAQLNAQILCALQYGVFDPDSRMRGSVACLQDYPGNGEGLFPVLGGRCAAR